MNSRRSFLRLVGSAAVATGILLISNGVISTESIKKQVEALSGDPVVPNFSANSRASLVSVKVYYSMMAQYTDLDEEDFVLQGPATVQELINTVLVRHPSMAGMIQTMLVLLDGVPAKPTSPLRDGDDVQFIPLSAGG
jgi:molybdopterin converting factor small subunit